MLNQVYAPIRDDMARVEESIQSIVNVDFPKLAEMLAHSLSGGGKRIRPGLTLLAGKFYKYNLESLMPMATAVELMHTATLVHDDAIDKSAVRRGRPTINTLWDEEKAILLGDYLFAKAGEFSTNTQNLHVVRLFTQTLATISSGELNQAFNAFNLNQTREDYLKRIASKTASLFILSTGSGAILSQAPEEAVQALKDYGYNLGIAFQIVDDILDFVGTEKELGKPVGSDLAQGTLTLPAMLVLERYPGDNPVRRLFETKGRDKAAIEKAMAMVREPAIIDECYKVVTSYYERACRNIEILPDKESRRSLKVLCEFTAARRT